MQNGSYGSSPCSRHLLCSATEVVFFLNVIPLFILCTDMNLPSVSFTCCLLLQGERVILKIHLFIWQYDRSPGEANLNVSERRRIQKKNPMKAACHLSGLLKVGAVFFPVPFHVNAPAGLQICTDNHLVTPQKICSRFFFFYKPHIDRKELKSHWKRCRMQEKTFI